MTFDLFSVRVQRIPADSTHTNEGRQRCLMKSCLLWRGSHFFYIFSVKQAVHHISAAVHTPHDANPGESVEHRFRYSSEGKNKPPHTLALTHTQSHPMFLFACSVRMSIITGVFDWILPPRCEPESVCISRPP